MDRLLRAEALEGFEDVCAELGMMDAPVAYTARAIYLEDRKREWDLLPYLMKHVPKAMALRSRLLATIGFFGFSRGYVLDDYRRVLANDSEALAVWNGPALMMSRWNDEVLRRFDNAKKTD